MTNDTTGAQLSSGKTEGQAQDAHGVAAFLQPRASPRTGPILGKLSPAVLNCLKTVFARPMCVVSCEHDADPRKEALSNPQRDPSTDALRPSQVIVSPDAECERILGLGITVEDVKALGLIVPHRLPKCAITECVIVTQDEATGKQTINLQEGDYVLCVVQGSCMKQNKGIYVEVSEDEEVPTGCIHKECVLDVKASGGRKMKDPLVAMYIRHTLWHENGVIPVTQRLMVVAKVTGFFKDVHPVLTTQPSQLGFYQSLPFRPAHLPPLLTPEQYKAMKNAAEQPAADTSETQDKDGLTKQEQAGKNGPAEQPAADASAAAKPTNTHEKESVAPGPKANAAVKASKKGPAEQPAAVGTAKTQDKDGTAKQPGPGPKAKAAVGLTKTHDKDKGMVTQAGHPGAKGGGAGGKKGAAGQLNAPAVSKQQQAKGANKAGKGINKAGTNKANTNTISTTNKAGKKAGAGHTGQKVGRVSTHDMGVQTDEA